MDVMKTAWKKSAGQLVSSLGVDAGRTLVSRIP